ncbi:MAG: DUF4384 domain-containing protein [Archangium sp.]|nr:DUF4384 domain-containing protein [Archangium sp.]
MTLPTLPARGDGCPPAVELERAATGEAVPEVVAHLPTCETCRSYVERLQVETQAFVNARPAERFVTQLQRRKPSRRPFVLLAVALAAAIALLVVFPGRSSPVLFKGSLLSISLKRGDVVSPLREGDTLREGDALRFSVKTERPGNAVVLNRDGRGKVTVVAPFNATAAQVVKEGTTVLDDSAVLDAATGRETFVAVFSEKPFEVAPLVGQLEAGQRVTCSGCVVDVASFDKP